LNVLKQLKSKNKTLTIVVGNPNNYIGYSVLSGKSEAVESGYGFMGIVGFKIIFKWLKYPNRYIYIDIRDLTLHVEDVTVISGTTHDTYDPDDSIVLPPGALTQIFQKIKEIVDSIRDIVDGAKDIAKSIEKITNNIKDITQNINDISNRLDKNDIKNKEQDDRIKENENKNNEQDNRLDNVDDNIEDHEERITELEKKIDDHEERITSNT
jgi:prefoldin subunit 5